MSPHILLLGGHGKIAQLMTPIFLSRSWSVTSVIRDQAQSSTIQKLGEGQKGTLDVLIHSLEDVKSEADAKSIIDKVNPDWIVWSAGAGGKPPASRTFTIDRDACIHFTQATLHTPTITKFVLISYLSSRRNKPAWWSSQAWSSSQERNQGTMKNYYTAKVAADEYLASVSMARGQDFAGICLRPGLLTDEKEGGVSLGKTKESGKTARQKVAEVAAELLESTYKGGWLDLLDGEEEVGKAVERVTKEDVDCFKGEDEERIRKIAAQ